MVTLEVTALMPGGREVTMRARIDTPRHAADGGWACEVQVAPVHDQILSVRGVDSFHAMWLACSLVLKLLAELKEAGAELKAADGSEFPLEAYRAGLDGKR